MKMHHQKNAYAKEPKGIRKLKIKEIRDKTKSFHL
jgi:hypothetical protein